jgi:hypothetical protein
MNMKNKDLERKLKRERVQMCINCKHFVECDDIGKLEECVDFAEVDDNRQVVIVDLDEYATLYKGG